MTKTLTFAAALAAVASLASPALAQDRHRPQNDATVSRTELTFTDADQVQGSRQSPWGDRLHARTRSAQRSLIRPRTGFVPELVTSVEKL